jgi:hypothetical protein
MHARDAPLLCHGADAVQVLRRGAGILRTPDSRRIDAATVREYYLECGLNHAFDFPVVGVVRCCISCRVHRPDVNLPLCQQQRRNHFCARGGKQPGGAAHVQGRAAVARRHVYSCTVAEQQIHHFHVSTPHRRMQRRFPSDVAGT